MFKCFYPGVRYESVYAIDFYKYYEAGCKVLLFDIDNTLVEHDAPADEKAIALFRELKEMGFSLFIISNNGKERAGSFAEAVGSDYISNASKPARKGFIEAMERVGASKDQTIMIGDQLFTDMWGAHNAGIFAIYTRPIARDPKFHIRLKRVGESIVMAFYKAYEKRHPQPKWIRKELS